MTAFMPAAIDLSVASLGRLATGYAAKPAESLEPLHFRLFGDLQRIVNFDSEVTHRALQLRVTQEQLHDV